MLGLFPGRPLDLYILTDACSGIGSNQTVHSDHVDALVLGVGAHGQSSCGSRSDYLHYIQGADADPFHELVAHPDNALSYIALIGLRCLQPNGFSFGHFSYAPAYLISIGVSIF